MILHPDSTVENADWTKGTWDLPYTSEEELKKALGDGYEHFKSLPAYRSRPWATNNKLAALDKRLK